MKIERIYHPYHLWEDYINGMWRKETKQYEEQNLQLVIDFTGNHFAYGKSMLRVVSEWHIACENNLSNISINRKAWIGHAACCIEYGWPEYLVRRAWWKLSSKQRELADKQAINAIKIWEQKQRSKTTLKRGNKDVTQMAFLMPHH